MTPIALRKLRRRLRLSQAKLAALLGVAPNTIARWERGEMGMRPAMDRLLLLVAKDVEQNGSEYGTYLARNSAKRKEKS